MSSPPPNYDRQADFTGFSTTHPDEQQPGVDLDAEFDDIRTVVNKIISRLAEIQRSDGPLANHSVGPDQISPELSIGFGAPSTWASGVNYAPPQTVFHDAKFYITIAAHLSGVTFDATKFSLIADLGSGAIDAAASALLAAASAAAALASQTAAHASELAAAASAAAAAAFDSSLYLTKANNLGAVADKPTSRTNLGLRIGTTKFFVQSGDPGGAASDGDVWIRIP